MVGLCFNRANTVVKNVAMGFCLPKTGEELLRVDANFNTVRFAVKLTLVVL
jgi:hypothetical protein